MATSKNTGSRSCTGNGLRALRALTIIAGLWGVLRRPQTRKDTTR